MSNDTHTARSRDPASGIVGFSAAHFVFRSIKLRHWFRRVVLSRGWLTFIVMGLAFFVFGVGTYNIFMLLSANVGLIAQYGWQALKDGAARQFVEIIVSGYLSMAAYVVFKTCEYRLAHDLADVDSTHGLDGAREDFQQQHMPDFERETTAEKLAPVALTLQIPAPPERELASNREAVRTNLGG